MAIHYFVCEDGAEHGPYEVAELRLMADAGSLHRDSWLRPEQGQGRIRADFVSGLFGEAVAAERPPGLETPKLPSRLGIAVLFSAIGLALILTVGAAFVAASLRAKHELGLRKESRTRLAELTRAFLQYAHDNDDRVPINRLSHGGGFVDEALIKGSPIEPYVKLAKINDLNPKSDRWFYAIDRGDDKLNRSANIESQVLLFERDAWFDGKVLASTLDGKLHTVDATSAKDESGNVMNF